MPWKTGMIISTNFNWIMKAILFSPNLTGVNNDNIGKAAFVIKYAQADSFMVKELNIEKTYLDEIHIKPDNYNKRYFITSFYYKQRRGNIDGFYFYIWDKQSRQAYL